MSSSLNILIADSDAIVAELLGTYLELHGMCGKAALDLKTPEGIMMSGADAQAVLVDPNLPGLSSSEDLERLVKLAKPRPVILLAGSVQHDLLRSVLRVGVRGLIPKSASLSTLTNAIRFVMAGETFVPAELLSQAADRNRGGALNLSEKEFEVLRQLQMGRMNKEIALDLGLSLESVKVLVRSLCNKLSAKNRTQVAVLASKLQLDSLSPIENWKNGG